MTTEEKSTLGKVIETAAEIAPDVIKFGVGLIASITQFVQAKTGISAERLQELVKQEMDDIAKVRASAKDADQSTYDATHPGG